MTYLEALRIERSTILNVGDVACQGISQDPADVMSQQELLFSILYGNSLDRIIELLEEAESTVDMSGPVNIATSPEELQRSGA